jgi:hypothetical protein
MTLLNTENSLQYNFSGLKQKTLYDVYISLENDYPDHQ